ncbi:hypothetical protein [Burkholderia territorii]|uniref:hypothetical protein n=1 Tax=Burkholderia territorii TaxID=1503055 RepID=UPI0012D8D799|nr:hypothetical protein [Burkholderia territorii]
MLVADAPAQPRDFYREIDCVLPHAALARPRRVVLDATAWIRFNFPTAPAEFENSGQERYLLSRSPALPSARLSRYRYTCFGLIAAGDILPKTATKRLSSLRFRRG